MSQICDLTKGHIVQGDRTKIIEHLLLDSRKTIAGEHTLFAAIHGIRHNSHLVLPELYQKGVRVFLIEEEVDLSALPEATVVRVNNTIDALQQLASHHRKTFSFPVIGITGSNGKTTVKEWLNVLLSEDFQIVRSPKSYNSQIGVPISVLNMSEANQLGIFEAGISEPSEMEKLSRVIQPTIGILTSIGTAHIENFLSKRHLIGEKLHLFSRSEVVIVPDDADVLQLIAPWQERKEIIIVPHCKWVTLSANGTANLIQFGNEDELFEVGFSDQASLENIGTCIACLRRLGYSNEIIRERLKRLAALEMRLQLIDGENGSVIVNDAYSNDLQSLDIALDFLSRNARGKEKIAVLSDFIQSGLNPTDLHLTVARMLQRHGISKWYSIGPAGLPHSADFGENYALFPTTEEFILSLDHDKFQQSAILIKGARCFTFEKIVSALQEQSHDSVLHIDLGAVIHNLNYFKTKLKPSTKLMVMVKAFGYGIGASQVASLLMFNKVDYLAVAYTDEGVALRKAGISLPIMVMNPERNSLQALIKYRLEPEIYSLRALLAFAKALEQSGNKNQYPIHLKIDTGMHRLGFEEPDLSELLEFLKQHPEMTIASIFTHLAATDNAELDDFTHQQLRIFDHCVHIMLAQLPNKPLLHALNTGGIQRFEQAQYDMVRLGVGLYGVSSSAAEQAALMPVNTLRTVISQIKTVRKGESIGYNRAFVAHQDMRSATIPLGYADGLRRQLSNGVGHVYIHGQKAPIVGNVCMDMCMVDVTSIACVAGDAVEVFGAEQTIYDFAKASGTIPYEILTSISQRVKRIYSQD